MLAITVTRAGYEPADETVSGAALAVARAVAFDGSTATETGFTAQIQGFDAGYTWTVTTATPGGARVDADQTVSDWGSGHRHRCRPGTKASVTVHADKPGQTLPGTGTANGTSLYGPARTPVFDEEALVRVEGGFTVPVTVDSYGTGGDGYTWTPTLSAVTVTVSARSWIPIRAWSRSPGWTPVTRRC